ADLTLPENGASPECVHTFKTEDPIIIQFDLPAECRKHFVLCGSADGAPLVKQGQTFNFQPVAVKR
ncbi:MAG TPA: hypothetical protein VNX46_02205, partial [Candidatus Acidoferrum sp.]|nr:hypothetical protein [Candidatus Acidoferrum sp.]